MDAQYARAFVNAASRVCQDLLDLDTLVLPPRMLDCHAPRHYITGIITLSGDRVGTVTIGFDRMVAVRATEYLLGNRPSKINAQVVDAVGELTNQIAGVARQNLLPISLSVSIPQVICGISQSINFPKGSKRISLPMTSLWGNLAIDFGFQTSPSELAQRGTINRRIDGVPDAVELSDRKTLMADREQIQSHTDKLMPAAQK